MKSAAAVAKKSREIIERQPGIHYYPPGPVGNAFLKCPSFVCAIKGPIGSGKSTTCVMKLIKNMQNQKPLRDGWKRRRTAIIRNTFPELRTTTIKTWHQWVPASQGIWRESGPPTHRIIDDANKIDWEIMFVALDRPDDVKKLLSMELSDAWINEAREVPRAILDGLTGRVGRFPPRDKEFGCTDPQVLMDTNPPDTDHWWYKMAEEPDPETLEKMMLIEAELHAIGALRPEQKLYEWFSQPGANDPGAENLENLDPGYYMKAMANKSPDWIRVYIDANYGYVQEGKPVYPEFRDNVHVRAFDLTPRLPLLAGFDFGLTPAATFGQQMPNGQWRIHSEVSTDDMGIVRFGELCKNHIAQFYPNFKLGNLTGDPAGDTRGGDERTCFDLLKSVGIHAQPASSNDPVLRRESFAAPMRRLIDGEPGILIHPVYCKRLRKGLAGSYNYKRIQVAGYEKYRDVPDKNIYSHVCEAGEYMMIGAGEGKAIMKREPVANRPKFAISDYNILGD